MGKFYAVRKGHQQGIYTDWPSCQAAVTGYTGAQFKSFKTEAEAQAYMAGVQQPAAAAPKPARNSSTQGKFYAIAKGHQTGIFQGSWDEVKHLVQGYPGALFKGFNSRDEAQQYLDSQPGSRAAGSTGATASITGNKRQFSQVDQPAPPAAFTGTLPSAARPSAAAAAAGGPALGLQFPAPQQQHSSVVTIHFDGGSRGNPGRAGYGYAITDRRTGLPLRYGCRPLPYGSTNNEAEYSGMIAGLRYALDVLKVRDVVVKGDSQLAVRQMLGQYKVNGPRILPLYREAKQLQEQFDSFEIQHVYREENGLADDLSNLAMDTDSVVDQIALGRAGLLRREMAMCLASAARVDGDPRYVEQLCTASNFLDAASVLLSRIWDNISSEEVMTDLVQRGWTDDTGGPPEPSNSQQQQQQVGVDGGGRQPGRGQQVVAVAAVTLGLQWADEIRRQEELLQQQQQAQKRQAGGSSSTGGRLPGSVAGVGSSSGTQLRSQLQLLASKSSSSCRDWSRALRGGHQGHALPGMLPGTRKHAVAADAGPAAHNVESQTAFRAGLRTRHMVNPASIAAVDAGSWPLMSRLSQGASSRMASREVGMRVLPAVATTSLRSASLGSPRARAAGVAVEAVVVAALSAGRLGRSSRRKDSAGTSRRMHSLRG